MVTWLVYNTQKQIAGTPIPVENKLSEVDSTSVRIRFTVPTGDCFNLVLGGKNEAILNALRGQIVISDGTNVLWEHSIRADTLTRCNWLERHALRGLIIGFTGTNGQLDRVLRQGTSYLLALDLESPQPLEGASIWLTYNQSWKTYESTVRVRVPKK